MVVVGGGEYRMLSVSMERPLEGVRFFAAQLPAAVLAVSSIEPRGTGSA